MDGPNGRLLEHVAGDAHVLEDVFRFGHYDIFWCFPYEREVKKYNNIMTNQKSVEATFAKYTCIDSSHSLMLVFNMVVLSCERWEVSNEQWAVIHEQWRKQNIW